MSLAELNFKYNDNKGEMIFPMEKVEGKIIDKKINDSIYFIKANIILKDDIIVLSKTKVDGIMLDFNLIGDVDYKSKISNHGFTTSNNKTDIELIKEESTESKAKKGEINKITLVVKKDFLSQLSTENPQIDKVLNFLEKPYCHKLLVSKTTDYQVNKILNQLYSSNMYEGSLGEIYLQSKVLELIYLEFHHLFKDEKISQKNVKFDEEDIQALKKAKKIIMSLDCDCTISTLSKKVALNEFKLKYGFKKYFNTSPGNLFLEQRMLKAKKLLESSEYNINEVSKIIGYKHQQSFSSAFTKYFGFKPKEIMKTRKYYF